MSPHPLDPLDADEIRRAAAVLRRDQGVTERWRFASIELLEPAKDLVRDWRAGEPIERGARVVCWNRDDGRAYKAIVSITGDAVVSWAHQPDGQPNMTVDEVHECDVAMRREPQVIEALARRGITDMDRVVVEAWAYGAHLLPEPYSDRRLGWADVWYRSQEGSNPYANPVTGLHLVVDLNSMELLEVEDTGVIDEPATMGEYVPRLVPGQRLRTDLRPLSIVQPDGPSFTLEGNLLRWQKWSLRVGFNYREGLVLHTIGYADGGRLRPVAHRMSLAEMVVPYRDPTSEHYRRTAFDIGEWGLGFMTTSLALGCDCLGEIAYLDAVLHDTAGEPYTIPNAICIHEEDDGVLWKHVDDESGAETRRMQRLVVSFHVTVGNYEYLVYWRFYQDGSIQAEVRATGIMVTTHFAPGRQPPYGTVVDERTYAPFHQHFLIARLDLDVDGDVNTVVASQSQALPLGPDNPHGVALVQRETPLRTEAEGMQDYDWATQRSWTVVNERVRNGLGGPVGYKLVPGDCFPAMLHPDSPVLHRAQVLAHTLWVTPYAAEERWPCGEFVVQSHDDRGLPVWTAADRPIADADVVLWYVFGIHHITRPEEWPVMPVDTVSFWLKPAGFFDRNPALDVAPSH
ncbi:MAG TPA: primary-amine oxidase [Solirubrobacteraceae bacterium]|jgi:primary-amine oxidase|nr:primary-amine oxidase [Solirubrobacteraceae bacterium]